MDNCVNNKSLKLEKILKYECELKELNLQLENVEKDYDYYSKVIDGEEFEIDTLARLEELINIIKNKIEDCVYMMNLSRLSWEEVCEIDENYEKQLYVY